MFLFLACIRAVEYIIQDYSSDRHFSSVQTQGGSPYYSTKEKPDTFKIIQDDKNDGNFVIQVITSTNKVLDISENGKTLIYYNYVDGDNQVFKFTKLKDDKYFLVFKDECISFNEGDSVFESRECNESDRSQWYKIVEYKDGDSKGPLPGPGDSIPGLNAPTVPPVAPPTSPTTPTKEDGPLVV